MRGLVTKSTGSWYVVEGENGKRIPCRIQGKFRTKGIKATNPIAVGDLLRDEHDPDQESAIITALEPRKNYIIRRSINLSKQVPSIGANLDQALLVVTLASPPTSFSFIDRFLV